MRPREESEEIQISKIHIEGAALQGNEIGRREPDS
ncbi:unnamed protein product [Linum tenue]|uniref:Uncharacterized protein n=1 Tax=Linum tenue TaxID=586396 RepID=A0AAV0KFW1_9ROSI|nr:unnamed protein product [Linum tenue]